jgi:hypothetical protein
VGVGNEINYERKMIMKKKNSAKRRLLSAAGMLAISAAMLSSATFAWFTMNKEVQVTGMQLKTRVSGNLLICDTNVEADYKSGTLTQERAALLEPVSTTKGADTTFFYTLDAAADGHKIKNVTGEGSDPFLAYSETADLTAADTKADKTKYDTQFNTKYGITTANTSGDYKTAYGYVDYTFYLKATADADNQQIRMTRCNLLKDGAALANDNDAWRIAVFAEKITQDSGAGDKTAAVTEATDTAKTILTTDGATNFTANQAAATTGSRGAVTYNTAAVIGTVATANTSEYYKVVVRVWLEGEDTTCYSAYYAQNLESYALDLAFELGKGTAVTNIGSTTAAFAPASNN